MVVIVRNEKSQQVRIVDLFTTTINEFISRFPSDEWFIVKYIHRY